jgi:hypothetical protein
LIVIYLLSSAELVASEAAGADPVFATGAEQEPGKQLEELHNLQVLLQVEF